MNITNLQNIDTDTIRNCFNESFSDYFVPMNLSPEVFEYKIKGENISFENSVGVFDNDQLVAFILHCCDEKSDSKTVYNSGTGVIPTHRGNGLTKEMYRFILPILKKNGFNSITLEVIQQNIQAIKSYEAVGFTYFRNLKCYKGEFLNTPKKPENIEFKPISDYDWKKMKSFWTLEPTWQSTPLVADNIKNRTTNIGAFVDNELVGYIIYVPSVKKILQIAVHPNYRNKGIGQYLLAAILKDEDKNILAVNIDAENVETNYFLTKIGLENYVNQIELICQL